MFFFCYHFLIPLSIISISLFHQSHISLVLTFSFTFTSLPLFSFHILLFTFPFLFLRFLHLSPFHSSYQYSFYHILFLSITFHLSFLSCSFALSYFSSICPGFNQFDITSLYHFFHLSFYFTAVPVLLIFLFFFVLA